MRWLGPYRSAFLAVLAIGLGLRLPGLAGDLWLDEIWSLKNALAQSSWWDVIVSLKTDNNHHLTSLWLRALGPLAPSMLYRLPSLLAGMATVVMAAYTSRRDGQAAAVVTALMFAVSYPLVYYASEARGYAPVVFFTLTAWYCLREFVDGQSRRHLAGFWVAAMLGVLSHVTFVEFFLAGAVWCDTHLQRSRRSLRAATGTTIAAFSLPALLFAVFYWIALRGVTIAGGPSGAPELVTAHTLSLLVGGPSAGPWMWLAGGLTAAFFVASLVAMIRRGDDRWLLYLLAGVILPVLMRVVQPQGPLSPRYLLVPGTFVLLAVSDLVARWLAHTAMTRVAAALTLTFACSGAIVHVLELGALGRGRFEQAVSRIAATPGTKVSVSSLGEFSQHDERVAMMIDYYAPRLPAGTHITYVPQADYTPAGVDWLITEQIQDFAEPTRDVITDFYGREFLFDSEYRSSRLTGISWRLYRRLTR